MHARFKCAKLAAIAAALATVGVATPSSAAPVSVNLRVEGSTTTVFEGAVTTDGHAITKDASGPHPCDGTNAGANPTPGPTMTSALDDASKSGAFSWDGTWFNGFQDFGVDRIGPDRNGGPPAFPSWGYALNYTPTQVGGCQQQVTGGDSVVFGYDFFSKSHLLKLAGAGSANVGEPVTVAVVDGKDGSAIPGASVGGQTTGPGGVATLTFSSTGVKRLKAQRPDSVRSNALDVCVHNGPDGLCGAGATTQGSAVGPDTTGPTARLAGLRAGARFSRRKAPRLLRGSVDADPSGLNAVYIRLWRHYRGHCYFYRAVSESLRRAPCGSHRELVFVGKGPSWSYLLPFRPPPGHYHLDAIAADRLGNGSPIVPGRNRVSFLVR